MADPSEHLRQSRHNCEFLDSPPLKPPSAKYSDWFVTICFYAAMHLVDLRLAELPGRNIDPQTHEIRDTLINRVLGPKYPALPARYFALKFMSVKARYHCLLTTEFNPVDAMQLYQDIAKILGISA